MSAQLENWVDCLEAAAQSTSQQRKKSQVILGVNGTPDDVVVDVTGVRIFKRYDGPWVEGMLLRNGRWVDVDADVHP
jgi:hypothetical protein